MKTRLKSLLKPVAVSIASQWGPHTQKNAEEKLWVLMYHRILPTSDVRFVQEEPGMIVCPETFAMHMQEIKQHFDVMFLGDWITAKKRGEKLPPKACAITFDDGWLDNYEYAFPILKTTATPATIFVVADKIGTDFQFWPNIISFLLLNGAGEKLSNHPLFNNLASLMVGQNHSNSPDKMAYIIGQLKHFSDDDIWKALTDVHWQTLCQSSPPQALMNWDQLASMQNSGLVKIGSHTCSHKRLTQALSVEELNYEIVGSKKILEDQLQTPIDLFCFPNGDYTAQGLDLVKTHYQAAVTTRRGINSYHDSLHELTRIGLHDEVSRNLTQFRARLSGWI